MGRALALGLLLLASACASNEDASVLVLFAPANSVLSEVEWAEIAPRVAETIKTFTPGHDAVAPAAGDFFAGRMGDKELWVAVSGKRCSIFCYTIKFARDAEYWIAEGDAFYRHSDRWLSAGRVALGLGSNGLPQLEVAVPGEPGKRVLCSTDFCLRERGWDRFAQAILQHCTRGNRHCSANQVTYTTGPASKRHAALLLDERDASPESVRAAYAVLAVVEPETLLDAAILYAFVPLDTDAEQDLVVTLQHPTQCGNLGCRGLALRRVPDGYVIAADAGDVHDREAIVAEVDTRARSVVVPLDEIVAADRALVAPEFPVDRSREWTLLTRWLLAQGLSPPPYVSVGRTDVDADGQDELVVALPFDGSAGAAYVLARTADGLREVSRTRARWTRYVSYVRRAP